MVRCLPGRGVRHTERTDIARRGENAELAPLSTRASDDIRLVLRHLERSHGTRTAYHAAGSTLKNLIHELAEQQIKGY